MNLYIFNFRFKKRRVVYLLLLMLVFFFIFDRIAFFSLREIHYNFYKSIKSDIFGKKIVKHEKEYYDTLILGTSRTKQGIHPWYLKDNLGLKSYKDAGAGKYLKYNYMFYKKYKKKYKVPKYLFYGFDYFIFAHKSSLLRLGILNKRSKRKTKKMGFNIDNKHKNFLSYISLLYRKKKEIDNLMIDLIDFISKKNNKNDDKGFISDFRGKKRTISLDDQKEPASWTKEKFSRFPGPEGNFLYDLLGELEKDKVKVFIVILPDFINVYKTNYEHDLFYKEIKQLCKKYPNVNILNFNSPDKFDLSNPRFFRDGKFGSRNSHLSYYGAEVFNKKLCQKISTSILPKKTKTPD